MLTDEIDLLPAISGQVLVPGAVLHELNHFRSPAKVRNWAANPPEWLAARSVVSVASHALMGLDIGEREAIQLALELAIETVLID